jgi:hypothetical protein
MTTGILDITEALEKARRNLLLIDSIIIVFWLAAPVDSIKVPGLGTDVAVRSTFAFILLGLSMAVFFAPSFWFEWRAMSLKHREISYGVNTINLVNRLISEQSTLETSVTETDKVISGFSNTLKSFHSSLDALDTSKFSEYIYKCLDPDKQQGLITIEAPTVYKQIEEFLEKCYEEFVRVQKDDHSTMTVQVQDFKNWTARSNEYLDETEKKLVAINRSFKNMSQQIATSQRLNYGAMYVALPWFYSSLAAAACLLGASGKFPPSTGAPPAPVEQTVPPIRLMPI